MPVQRARLWQYADRPPSRHPIAPLYHVKAQSTLEAGTALLAFSVGEASSMLLVLSRDSEPVAFPLAVNAGGLLVKVQNLVEDLYNGRSDLGASGLRLRRAQSRARQLYDLLIRPAEALLRDAERWVILPDAALHSLPFAALVETPPGVRVRYLLESKPLSFAQSTTQLLVLRQHVRATTTRRLAAFGDPAYDRSGAENELVPAFRSLRDLAALRSLPGSRREVNAIAELFDDSRTFLGEQASEQALRSLGPIDYLHLACHGFANRESPFDSSIALAANRKSLSASGNGFLHAWEIMQDFELESQLVVLSACNTAAGRAMGGEGVVGLVRAFQAAGAKSVLAPLWTIQDDRAPDLMIDFYTRLKEGLPKAEALREAQLSMLRRDSREETPPYFWAGFQLFGDHR
ncbi:MAG: CHAT domain-containing protein, partial [Acidobacteriota bacterium]